MNRTQRKEEIKSILWQAMPLPAETDPSFYETLLAQLGVSTPQDMAILSSIISDEIMRAHREEVSSVALDAFLDWLMGKRL
jgi:hypothetical protein